MLKIMGKNIALDVLSSMVKLCKVAAVGKFYIFLSISADGSQDFPPIA